MTPTEIAELANSIINNLYKLARQIDSEYAEECVETSCTNLKPTNTNDKIVRHLIHTGEMLNASGLLDLPENTPCVGCHFHKNPLGYRWWI